MAKWKHYCDICQYVNDDSLSIRKKLEKVADQLTRCRAFDDETFADELLEISELDEPDLTNEGDYLLSQIYDFADEERIWMGE